MSTKTDPRSESEDEDWMRDDVIFAGEKAAKKVNLLPPNSSAAHSLRVAKNRPIPAVASAAARTRDETLQALNTPLDMTPTVNNIGARLMQKMGYESSTASELRGPIVVDLKVGRSGLGLETVLNDRQEEAEERARKRVAMVDEMKGDYRERLHAKQLERQVMHDVVTSRRACEHLDTTAGLTGFEFMWPRRRKPTAAIDTSLTATPDENEIDLGEEELPPFELLTPIEQLIQLTARLRAVHFYCVWCGTAFDDANELDAKCPGATREDHDD